ncbi:GAF domain-containing protein [Hymenobacter sp. NBH84]|uniref:ATP-binding protein n=1 Tax=Hymenobacter sp. NBH84 TaxID=2596915 RepID=UPI001628EC4F|nr:ATP-binding protein [Hymenobacter sp. NBH84]QNE40528.1 GAF domain-containing protein [Hymenobacter sp. NBH84]
MDQSTVSHTSELLSDMPTTLTNCDREPIHIPGAVQPYGFLLCLDEQTQRVVQASANTQSLLGIPAEELLGAGLERLLPPAQLAELDALWPTLTDTPKLLGVQLHHTPEQPFYKLIVHRYDGLLWAEFEPVDSNSPGVVDLATLNTALGQMLGAATVLDFCQHAVEQVRSITGFDRVAMYRFAADESGEVVAEAIRPDLDPWLGLHYPATDIPQQARAMYLKNWLRFIPDASYRPAPLVPVRNPTTGRSPDMTHAVLRSVSPIHLEYLHNLGSAATMTISVIREGKLWGMITCHHLTPHLVSYELRELCLFIGKTFSVLLPTKEQQDQQAYQLHIQKTRARLFEQMNSSADFIKGLYQQTATLLDVFACGGAAICFEDEIVTLGTTPTPDQIQGVVAWLRQHAPEDVFHTDSYAQLNPGGVAIRSTASGILAITLAQAANDYILWFRPEQLQTVTWAGRTQKVETKADGQIFLSPRQSFEAWKQTVENTAAAWLPLEIEAAQELRLHIADIRLKIFNELQARATSLSRLNAELERSNDELDSFAYVASHDLKEPLRGIHNYSIFLLEDYADRLDAEGVSKLQTLVRLSQRMEALIESLLQISRVGRLDLVPIPTDMNELVSGVLELLAPRLEQTHTTVTVAGPLPTILADPIRLGEVFNNLITNAMRYSNDPEKYVTIGVAAANASSVADFPSPEQFDVFYVRDQGIGIDPKHHENIFKIFKRLHSQDKYGGGTGAGLAIAKKMIEKHGGKLWVESVLGQGATFYFSLPKAL